MIFSMWSVFRRTATLSYHRPAAYFSGERFQNTTNQEEITVEIPLNPTHFATRTPEEVLSTFAHEMVHLWQHHFGKPPTKSYHDREWAVV
jgi:predicted SprT family Zn-dependent metalloprotease